MAGWCFRCDAAVDGDSCPTCGNPPTVVEEPQAAVPSARWWTRIPRRTWFAVGLALVVLLYTLFESAFRVVD